VAIVPYQMSPGDEKVVADRLYGVLSNPPNITPSPTPEGQPASVAGQWDVRLDFQYGSAAHTVLLEQDGAKLVGTHHGEFASGDLTGNVAANTVRFQSSLPTDGVRVSFQFSGTFAENKIVGTVGLGEYGSARFTAERHHYRTARRG
jgi:D-glucosaminate-6-phosphate ammonia-lyase